MIQDIEPHIYHNEFAVKSPKRSDYLIVIKDQTLYMRKTEETIDFIAAGDIEDRLRNKYQFTYLFSVDEHCFFLLDPQKKCDETLYAYLEQTDIICKIGLQGIRSLQPMWKEFAAITAVQLFNWYKNRRFCGCCGSRMEKSRTERAMVCPSCGLTEYPKICPAVIIGITNGDKIVMTKYAGREFKHYALVAGFTEIGESFEETVKREVMEEVGLCVKNISYYKSQPWSFSDTILAGFFCQVEGSNQFHIDTQELSTAEWVARENITPREPDISLTSEMIEAFRTGQYPGYDRWEKIQ